MLVDLGVLGQDRHGNEITGKLVERSLDHAGIHTNKNMIPFDPKPPMTTSGIRLGSPAATTRGLGAAEFEQIGRWLADVAKDPTNADLQEETRREVMAMMQRFPVPA
jgi:glycine hydroxymethyltransferase